jgi:hypothetical protein
MVLACRAVRRGAEHALVSCDFPFGPLQEGPGPAVKAALTLVKEGGADLVKLDGASTFPEAVRAITRAGIPVWAQFGITPQTALKYGGIANAGPDLATEMKDRLLDEAALLEASGAALLDFTNSGPVAGPAVTHAMTIPVIGGLGGGPWLDGRVRMGFAAIGYLASALDDKVERYANVRRPRSTPSRPSPPTSAKDGRSRARRARRVERGDRHHRRHHHALRDPRRRPTAPHVLPRRLRRDHREVVDAGHLRDDQAARSPAAAVPLHRVRPP